MSVIVRHPIVLSPMHRRRLARQDGLAPEAFDERMRRQERRIASAGGPSLGEAELRFIEACKSGRIKPQDIAGHDVHAALTRRMVRDLNEQGARERNEPGTA